MHFRRVLKYIMKLPAASCGVSVLLYISRCRKPPLLTKYLLILIFSGYEIITVKHSSFFGALYNPGPPPHSEVFNGPDQRHWAPPGKRLKNRHFFTDVLKPHESHHTIQHINVHGLEPTRVDLQNLRPTYYFLMVVHSKSTSFSWAVIKRWKGLEEYNRGWDYVKLSEFIDDYK